MDSDMNDTKKLPEAFCERMESFLGEEWEAFLASYDQSRYYGLRMNPLKSSPEAFAVQIPFSLKPVSWAEEGFYYQAEEQPGKAVLHEAGAYYIQEPSAMAVAEILDPRPGERILDLCAAPGGKSTQIAGRMRGEGLLVANEVILDRARILSRNVERMGIRNCVVCSEAPERMAELFPGFFDRILVDAPCSGEGMFRKDETAVEQWSEAHVRMCADRQLMILEEAAKMLRPGGVLVYSTCTFAPEENEGTISRFLHRQEAFVIEEVPHDPAFAPGRAQWTEEPAPGLEHTLRLWPHRLKGEGHYIARLRRAGAADASASLSVHRDGEGQMASVPVHRGGQGASASAPISVRRSGRMASVRSGNRAGIGQRKGADGLSVFLEKELGLRPDWPGWQHGSVQRFGEQIYLVPAEMIPMQGIKVLRPGLHLATEKKNRLEPAHALALALKPSETDKTMELSCEEAVRYLRGESLPCQDRKGWTLLCCQGYPLGFGKAAGGQMKNHYPKGLRREAVG